MSVDVKAKCRNRKWAIWGFLCSLTSTFESHLIADTFLLLKYWMQEFSSVLFCYCSTFTAVKVEVVLYPGRKVLTKVSSQDWLLTHRYDSIIKSHLVYSCDTHTVVGDEDDRHPAGCLGDPDGQCVSARPRASPGSRCKWPPRLGSKNEHFNM